MASRRLISSISVPLSRYVMGRCWFATSAKVDPITRIIMDKLNDVKKGKGFQITPESEKRLKEEQERLRRVYGDGNMEEFPKLDISK